MIEKLVYPLMSLVIVSVAISDIPSPCASLSPDVSLVQNTPGRKLELSLSSPVLGSPHPTSALSSNS